MATIQAFRALHPEPFRNCLKTLLETGARQRPETPEGQQQAYDDIRENLSGLLESGGLRTDQRPAIFIYEHKGQTGVWALTSLTDEIRTHELTLDDSVRRIRNYQENTRLEGSPVLLTYAPDSFINRIITTTKTSQKPVRSGEHTLWKIDDAALLGQLIQAFAKIKNVYMADGHHRLASAAFDTISSLYLSFDELRIREYHRVILPATSCDKVELLQRINRHFHILESTGNRAVQPKQPGNFGLYIEGAWYHLRAKAAGTAFDAALLQEQVLAPLLDIQDPKTDSRLKYAGGENALDEMQAIFREHPSAIGFTLCPLPLEQLVRAADTGQVLPPKSTWIVPKIPYGLIIYQH